MTSKRVSAGALEGPDRGDAMATCDCREGEGISHSNGADDVTCDGQGLGGEVDERSATDHELMLMEECRDASGDAGEVGAAR